MRCCIESFVLLLARLWFQFAQAFAYIIQYVEISHAVFVRASQTCINQMANNAVEYLTWYLSLDEYVFRFFVLT